MKLYQAVLTRMLLIGGIIFFSGCAFTNEGLVDMRRTDNSFKYIELKNEIEFFKSNLATWLEDSEKKGKFVLIKEKKEIGIYESYKSAHEDGIKKYGDGNSRGISHKHPFLVVQIRPDFTLPNATTLSAKNFSLVSNDELTGSRFEKGATLSIHLRTAFIKDFSELLEFNGEIAVVINAFEMDKDNDFKFSDSQQKDGRLVFYSDDVTKGQFLNFNNMPVYGPKTYSGRPVGIRAAIFELDTNSEQIKVMLSTLAKAGALAYPPASPALSMLNGLGQSLFSGDLNDTEFRYAMVLDPQDGVETLNHFVLEAGNYVFIRSEDRTKQIPWDELVLNENEGRIYWKNIKDEKGKRTLFNNDSYLILEINKGTSAESIDLPQHTFGPFLEELKKQDKQKAEGLTEARNSIIKVFNQRSQITNFSKAKELLAKYRRNQTKLNKDNNDERAKVNIRDTSREVLKMLKGSIKNDKKLKDDKKFKGSGSLKEEPGVLSQEQFEYVLTNLKDNSNPDLIGQESLTLEGIANQISNKKLLDTSSKSMIHLQKPSKSK